MKSPETMAIEWALTVYKNMDSPEAKDMAKDFLAGYACANAKIEGLEKAIDREAILKVCRDWKWYWMSQEERYKVTAYGIDSNMIHHLADKITEHLTRQVAE